MTICFRSLRLVSYLALIIVAGEGILTADILTGTTETTCTVNGVATPCQTGSPLPAAGAAVYEAQFEPVPGTLEVDYFAVAATDFASGLTSAFASMTTDLFGTTAGPVRQGCIDFQLHDTSVSSPFGAARRVNASVNGMHAGLPSPCNGRDNFTLGVPFVISLSAWAAADYHNPYHLDASAAGAAVVTVILYDTSGDIVPILPAPPMNIPEPAGLGFAALALLGTGVLFSKRSRYSSSVRVRLRICRSVDVWRALD
jgi:hypothetical protein